MKLMIPVQAATDADMALDLGLALARDLGAHAEVFHAQPDASLLIPPVFDGATGLSQLGQLLLEMQADADAHTAEIDTLVETRAARAGLSPHPGEGPSLAYVTQIGDPDRLIAHRARMADLVVVVRGDPDRLERVIVDAALWRGRRPVLLYPADIVDRRMGRPRRVVVAWNGSAEAAAALSATLPLLARGAAAEVVVIDGVVSPDETDGMAEYLASHGIGSEIAAVASEGRTVSEVLIDHAIDCSADLLVMGAYTHSRVREFVLGGVTQQILADAPLPVLLAH